MHALRNIKIMRKKIVTTFLSLFIVFSVFATDGILEKLKQIPEISGIQEKKVNAFKVYYEFWFEQPIDHADLSKGTFKQKVFLGHKSLSAPVVAELEGYQIRLRNESELSALFETNQVGVEHRFFDRSVPEGGIPWEYLTIQQAATDHHKIIQAIKKYIYPMSKWITTGISKGGQTVIFHRYFYPEDVDITVPYVAPLNLSYIDSRLEKFLERLGNPKGKNFGGLLTGNDVNASRWTIRDFQILCFEHQEKLSVMLEEFSQRRKYSYELVGGVKRALQLIILEYPFAFWQWGYNVANIPEKESSELKEIFDHLIKVSSPDFFSDQGIMKLQPFFYAALTETGMYDYNIKPFKKYLNDEENIDFSFAMPKGVEKKAFNEEQMKKINKWLQTDAEKILFVYGGSDPWYATGVDLKKNFKCRKYVRGDMHHGCRIKDFDPVSREDLIDTLVEWLKE